MKSFQILIIALLFVKLSRETVVEYEKLCPELSREDIAKKYLAEYDSMVGNFEEHEKQTMKVHTHDNFMEMHMMPGHLPNKKSDEELLELNAQYYSYRKQYDSSGKFLNDSDFGLFGINPFIKDLFYKNNADPEVRKNFSKYFSFFLYCFSMPEVELNKDAIATVPSNVSRVAVRRFIFMQRPVRQTLQVMLKLGYQNPEKKFIITIKNRMKILRHIIQMQQFLKTIDMKLCRFRFGTLLLYKVPSGKLATFSAISSTKQDYHHFHILNLVNEHIYPKDHPCVESSPERRYSPEAFNPKNFDQSMYEKGKIHDDYANQFSLAMLALGFEYMYRVSPVDITDTLICFSRQYFANVKKNKIAKYSTYDLYWDNCSDFVKNYPDIRDKFETFLSYQYNRMIMYNYMKKFAKLPPSVVADKENFFDSFFDREEDYEFESRFVAYHFVAFMIFKMNFKNLKKITFNYLQGFQDSMEVTFMDFYELIYPKSSYTIPKHPKVLFDESNLNKLIEYICSIKYDDQLVGIYFDVIQGCFKNYISPTSGVTDYLPLLDHVISKHDEAMEFMTKEFKRMKLRDLVDIVYQVRNGKVYMRGYDALKVIILTNKRVMAQGMLLA